MYELGVKLSNAQGTSFTVFFRPLSYHDWTIYSDPVVCMEPSAIREIFNRYVTRILDDGGNESSLDALLAHGPAMVNTAVESIIDRSGFGNDGETFPDLVDKLEQSCNTLMGNYDTFLFLHLIKINPEAYFALLREDATIRAQVIAMIQKITGINVLRRFKEATESGAEIDIMSSPRDYDQKQKRREAAPSKDRGLFNQQKPPVIPSQNMPDSQLKEMVMNSQRALQEALERGKTSPTKTFDWAKDEAQFGGADRKHDQDVVTQAPDKRFPVGR